MSLAFRSPADLLLDRLASYEQRLRALERMPSGTKSLGRGQIASVKWIALPYNATFSDLAGSFQTGQYGIDALGLVHLRGVIKKTSQFAAADFVATLPAGYRPALTELFLIATSDVSALWTVDNAGGLRMSGFTNGAAPSAGNIYTSLSGVAFQQVN